MLYLKNNLAKEEKETRREEFKIIADILSLASRPINKTHIMYKANLSFTQLERYLRRVLSCGLLEQKNSPITYQITEKGKRFLKIYHQMMQILYSEQ
ncbi:MAG: winged helix-turn-helix domain-containing protein [Candidatus Aenigmatarchaeota archaeon]